MEPDQSVELDMEPEPDMALPPACSNGVDDDGDGSIDYPRDVGCTHPEDDDELDPEVFACADGLDNDMDGLIDLDDPGCGAPLDPSEESACGPHEAIDISSSRLTITDSEGAPAAFEACRSNDAPEQVFLFTLRQPVEYLYFSTEGSAFDTLLSVRRGCEPTSAEVACNDDVSGAGGPKTSAVQLDNPALGDYYVIVDGYGDSAGRVVLRVEAGVAEGDPCPPEDSPLVCPRGQACDADGLCAPAACSDGEDNDGDERADYPADPGCERPEDRDESDPETLPECGDGLDNDGEGLIDFPNDPDCESASDPREGRSPECDDGVDNDRDGLIDAGFDPGCADADDNNEYNPPACDDGLDNDEDGRVDFPLDPGCVSEDDASERTPRDPPQCADDIDNDGDGLIDYPEDALSCRAASDTTEDNPCDRRAFRDITGLTSARGTHEGEPNDFWGSCGGDEESESLLVWRVDADRPLESLSFRTRNSEAIVALYARDTCDSSEEIFCETNSAFSPVEVGARDAGEDVYLFVDSRFFPGIWRVQIDAKLATGARCDGSGLAGERWRCADGLSCVEEISGVSRCLRPQCADGQDNDGDGRVDFPNDPGCVDALDLSEITPDPVPACANDIDEDRDGLFDFGEDPDCSSAADPFEGPDCRDGIDNDGDGEIDFAGGDSACACDDDPSEGTREPACRDQCDNDGDGLIDMLDPGCQDPDDADEFNAPECSDGLDNDGDSLVDFPNDPGCLSLNDEDETTPDPAPECGDGQDNDEDGRVDFPDDPDCESASDPQERGICDQPPLSITASGVTLGATSDERGSQVGSCGFGAASEVVYLLESEHPRDIEADTVGSAFNTVLYARSACEASVEGSSTELACSQDAQGAVTSALSLTAVSGPIYLFVDGFGAQSGAYTLNVSARYPESGRCALDAPEYLRCPEGSLCQLDPTDGLSRCLIQP